MKNRFYRSSGHLKKLGRILGIILLTAVILSAVLFFLLRSWTVYDEDGAHIIFPWSEARQQ